MFKWNFFKDTLAVEELETVVFMTGKNIWMEHIQIHAVLLGGKFVNQLEICIY